MNMLDTEKLSREAYEFIIKNKTLLYESFASTDIFQTKDIPVTLFMAGSPGAGKTEYSKALIEIANRSASPIVRIDADEIRDIIPQYNGRNSDIVQKAASTGVHKLYDYCLTHKYDAIIDGTFAKFELAYRNVKRSLSRGRLVGIYYVYQDPIIAWEFVKKREKIEGRKVPKKVFIEAFFNSRINVVQIKKIFGDKVKLYLVIKNYQNNTHSFYSDINRIDNYLKFGYSKNELNKLITD